MIGRRSFLQLAATSPLLANIPVDNLKYKVVCKPGFKPALNGFPGAYPATAVRVHADAAIDAAANKVNTQTVQQMLSAGMRDLTKTSEDRDAWAKFITPEDVVGIKVNCSGAPDIHTNPELVSAIIENLIKVGVPASNVYIYDRFENQLQIVNYAPHVQPGVNVHGAESSRGSILGYDPYTYVEISFFREDDTRSNLIRLVSEKLTKVINVPTMKEHQAAGVTGCLKNIAYGNFSNVARSHRKEVTNTYSFIGTLAAAEPLRSKTVLNVMDGLRSVWHAGPFLRKPEYLFFPKQIVVGTDPVAMDHLLIEMIEEKRKEMGAPSIFDRSMSLVKHSREPDPSYNAFIREPGHIEYAGKLGLGTFERSQIKERTISL